jgi:plasmid stability protein
MAQLLVRNLDDPLKGRLQRRARRHGRSMEAEAREILRNALREEDLPATGLGTASVETFRGAGLQDGEEIPEWRGHPIEPIVFEP